MTTAAETEGWLPGGRPLVADDLVAAPDDGYRYELIDGSLIVSPSPITVHQRIVVRLIRHLDPACPDDHEVLVAPYDVRLADDTVVQPDVVVARREDLTATNLPTAPTLAIEVLSPSTRGVDLLLKKERLERAGCASYWVVDPTDGGRLIAWDLDGTGHYEQVGDVRGDDTWTATLPYAVTICPATLLA